MEERIRQDLINAFDELNVIVQTSYYLEDDENIQQRIKRITDDILSILIKAYMKGIEHAILMLAYDELEADTDKMYSAIYEKIAGLDFQDRVSEHVRKGDITGLIVLGESEYHRVYNRAIYDGLVDFRENGNLGASKVWRTMGDERVRDTHAYLEGMEIDVEEEFYTYDGDHAPYPGGFQKAENNVNCRCHIMIVMTSGL